MGKNRGLMPLCVVLNLVAINFQTILYLETSLRQVILIYSDRRRSKGVDSPDTAEDARVDPIDFTGPRSLCH